ncbi:3,4-dihydroxy-2-butanone 4-phosphate synthase-domain-containing protein [Pelagophyceae sp. CCMP2097]|nr:3,4-dihydroxy-2-butanone 4-phosphate synthase-domain-containing protein [Pelagophyceae sp. CCMP2097]|mmetsp:Transcript_482/g.1719  ORF Transcript_482/g.1719 Transcript_482/m.1719 type:complete len:524 (+) Transcript_482:82-1653(+)
MPLSGSRRSPAASTRGLAAVALAMLFAPESQNHFADALTAQTTRHSRVGASSATRMPTEAEVAASSGGWCLGRASVEAAIEAIREGKAVLVTDDADRENEGDLIFAAECATAETLAFVVRHTSGVICVAMPGDRLDDLRLRPMCEMNEDPKGTAFAITVDLKGGGVTTGISASDRARTLRALADPTSVADDFCRPGHLFPLRARAGGVLERGGHTEAAVDLARLAGLYPAGALCEVVRDSDGEMSRAPDLDIFAEEHGLVLTTIADMQQYFREVMGVEDVYSRSNAEATVAVPSGAPTVRLGAVTRMPTKHGSFDAICCTEIKSGLEHIALIRGHVAPKAAGAALEALAPGALPPLVRVHSECATGDLFGSRRCDCGEQLERAMAAVATADDGVVLYIRGHEGRGIGLGSKLRAYALQDSGRDTIEANLDQGLPVDARSYKAAAEILLSLGVHTVRLMTNNPAKCAELEAHGVKVFERVPLVTTPNEVNFKYLLTKQEKMGHLLNLPAEFPEFLPAEFDAAAP